VLTGAQLTRRQASIRARRARRHEARLRTRSLNGRTDHALDASDLIGTRINEAVVTGFKRHRPRGQLATDATLLDQYLVGPGATVIYLTAADRARRSGSKEESEIQGMNRLQCKCFRVAL
jgi:hypothetical protein